jgi:hypothetical protein
LDLASLTTTCTSECMCTHKHVCIYVNMYIHICIHTPLLVDLTPYHTRTHAHETIHTCINTHIYTHHPMHTYIHTYKHTWTAASSKSTPSFGSASVLLHAAAARIHAYETVHIYIRIYTPPHAYIHTIHTTPCIHTYLDTYLDGSIFDNHTFLRRRLGLTRRSGSSRLWCGGHRIGLHWRGRDLDGQIEGGEH